VMDGLVDEAVHRHLHERHHDGEVCDRLVPANVEHLLAEHGAERAHHAASSFLRAAEASSVSVTKTSSRLGAISRKLACANPAPFRRSPISSSATPRSMTACTAWPKIVARSQ